MTRIDRFPRFGVAVVVIVAFVGAALPALAADGSKKNVTFAKDVAPIFQAKCQVCHRPGSMAPMSLVTFQDARPWARSIKNRVELREMPPWHLDKRVGIQKFKNDRSLTEEQIDTIFSWVDNGAPLGNPKDLPPPVQWPDENSWAIGKPDLIVTAPEHTVYANGPDYWVDQVVPSGLTEDRYIKAVETKPSREGRRVVHHAGTSLVQTGDTGIREESGLAEYAVGKYGSIYPEGTGKILRGGSQIKFNFHYHAIGEEISDRTSVGFIFYPKGYVPKYRVTDPFPNDNGDLDIPPNSMARNDVYFPLTENTRLITFQPHQHMRGKAMCMEAIYLNGRREMLNCVDRWDFNWHVAYVYADDAAPLLPKGTVLHFIGVFDNTVANKRNPDPTVWVGWGQRSIDDMNACHVDMVYLDDEDFKRQVEERKSKPLQSQQQ